jgi:glucokinase
MADSGLVLAGDVGGTNTRLALYDRRSGPRRPVVQARYPSGEHDSLQAIVAHFLAGLDAPVSAAAIGVAGPVLEGRARITNLRWVVDGPLLAHQLGLDHVTLVNDLVATAVAVPHLSPDELHPLDGAEPVAGGPIGVVAPGTGLGEAYLLWNGERYDAHPSEGGHASFAPRNDVEIDLLRFLLGRYDHVSYERVCSGSGLPNVYDFFRHRHPDELTPAVAQAVAAAADPTPVIMRAGLDPQRPDPVCRRTIETFVSILGAECGNLALKLLATGGIFLGGGIPPRIVDLLDSERFRRTYSHKGRFGEMVSRMPVRVILEPGAALIGAAWTAICDDP